MRQPPVVGISFFRDVEVSGERADWFTEHGSPSSILPLAALLLVGCSSSGKNAGTVPVTGKVTYNGQPVEGATVTFAGDAGMTPGAAMTMAEGAYSLNVKPGSYTVIVTKTDVPLNTQPMSMEEAAAQGAKPPEEPKELLPAKYRSATDSPLKFEVKPSGANTFDLTLTDG